ncbi:MAG TPA: UDP-N-acetylglucosamine--N-acetylmuramyl-(pentapeptide) pyrophosphoryl-undecaprenol N-acetylglucosamine transferase, partial [Bacteroidia bacterium]|nr:UDP-N-acetylglucosamine--N-acetylmuramyl-(pentapeptide) pyrophosphoryl-undecaprenol N-acetylglucosamine transferase [Bacteroidia bacterium]
MLDGKFDEAMSFFSFNPSQKTLLIVGGSQGARSINKSILAGLEKLKAAGVQLIWQTGKLFYEEAQRAVAEVGYGQARVFDFIARMDFAYAAANLVVSRAGASTVSELTLTGKPYTLANQERVAI